MTLIEYTLLAVSSLFVIVDPFATVPAFLAMTPTDTPEQRIRMARLACCVMAGVLIVFAAAGQWIFKFLGITMPAFQLAASVVLLLVALDMLRAQRSRVHETDEETAAGVEKTDIAVAPLAIPMLAGRIANALGTRKDIAEIAPDGIDAQLKKLYYDTANSFYAPTIASLTPRRSVTTGVNCSASRWLSCRAWRAFGGSVGA